MTIWRPSPPYVYVLPREPPNYPASSHQDVRSHPAETQRQRGKREGQEQRRERGPGTETVVGDQRQDGHRGDHITSSHKEHRNAEVGDRVDERGDERHPRRALQERQVHIGQHAEPGGPEIAGGLLQRPVDLSKSGGRGLVGKGEIPERQRQDENPDGPRERDRWAVESQEVADAEKHARDRRGLHGREWSCTISCRPNAVPKGTGGPPAAAAGWPASPRRAGPPILRFDTRPPWRGSGNLPR